MIDLAGLPHDLSGGGSFLRFYVDTHKLSEEDLVEEAKLHNLVRISSYKLDKRQKLVMFMSTTDETVQERGFGDSK